MQGVSGPQSASGRKFVSPRSGKDPGEIRRKMLANRSRAGVRQVSDVAVGDAVAGNR